MPDVTIESISIEITASAEKADKALKELTENLDKLRAACQSGLEGADKVAQGIKKIAEAAKDFESINIDKLKSLSSVLNAIKKIENVPDLSQFSRSISKVVEAANSISGSDMTMFTANMQSFVSAVQPLSGLQGLGDISSAVTALKALPSVAKGLSRMDMGTFATQMQQITAAIQPFITQMQSLSTAFSGLPAPIQQSVANIANYNTNVDNANRRTQELGKSLRLVNFMAVYTIAKRITGYLKGFIDTSTEYVENLNLFSVTMGDAADEALKFAEQVNEAMGIDVSQWVRNQGVFKQMTSGFGMVEDKANLVSKNLTQLGYDISSYFNISVDDAMQKLQSGMAGEIEPLELAA